MNVIVKTSYSYGLVFFGPDDLATSYDVKFLVENITTIHEYFRNHIIVQSYDIDDYIDFLWLSKFVQFESIISLALNDDIRAKLVDSIKIIKHYYNQYKIKLVVIFLQNNYVDVFNYSSDNLFHYDMIRLSIDFIYSHSNSFDDEIFQYIENNYWHLVIDNFSTYSQYYAKHVDRFEKHVFNEKIAISNIQNFNRVFDVLEKFYKEPFVNIITRSAKAVCLEILKLSDSISAENYLETLDLIEKGKRIAIKFKFKEAYLFESLDDKNKTVRDAFFEKYGHKIEYGPIDLTKDIIKLKESKAQGFIKFLKFSHTYDKESNKIISSFDSVMTSQYSFTDSIKNIGEESNDYFTPSRLSTIGFLLDVYWRLLYLCIRDEELFDSLLNYYHSTLHKLMMDGIITQVDIDEFTGLSSLIKSLIDFGEEQKLLKQSLSYSTCLMLCAYIEMILSKLFDSVSSDESYIDKKFLTLGSYLEKKEMVEYLGNHHSRILEYQLSRVPGTNIGLNIRNKLMHHIDIDFESMDLGRVVQVLYIFTSLINAIGIHYIALPPAESDK